MKPHQPSSAELRFEFEAFANEYKEAVTPPHTHSGRAERALRAIDAILDCALDLGYIALEAEAADERQAA